MDSLKAEFQRDIIDFANSTSLTGRLNLTKLKTNKGILKSKYVRMPHIIPFHEFAVYLQTLYFWRFQKNL